MSALDDYKDIYNKFVVKITDLHNNNVLFTKQPSVRNGTDLRRVLRELKIIEKHLWAASVKTSKEVSKEKGRGRPKKEKNKNG